MSSYDQYHREYYQSHKSQIYQYNRECRELRKKLHMCLYCGKQDAYTLNGRSRCAECVERETTRARERRGYHPAWMREKKTKPDINRPRGGNGFCWQCNKEPRIDGKAMCAGCYAKKVQTAMHNLEKARKNNVWRTIRCHCCGLQAEERLQS